MTGEPILNSPKSDDLSESLIVVEAKTKQFLHRRTHVLKDRCYVLLL